MKRTAVAVLIALAAVGCTSHHKPSASKSATPTPNYTGPPAVLPVPQAGVVLSDAKAPWPPPVLLENGALSAAYVKAAGFPYSHEMLTVHYHAHLDVILDGKATPVPAYIGWIAKGRTATALAPLHTHLPDGIIHIENSVPATFLLGQFFIEWGVRLSPTCIGGYCAGNGNSLAVYVNGKPYAGDPNGIVLTKHEQIAIEWGPTGKLPKPRSSYHFPLGD